MKELIARGDLERCLVVCPGSLAEQWQDELEHRFQLHFTVYTSEALQAARPANWFEKNDLVIARLDMLSRNEEVQELLQAPDCRLDLVVCDEAHKMSAAYFGRRVKYTKRYRLGQLLGRLTRHFLLMTATPHNGKEDDFQLFMALLDGDRFEGRFRSGVHRADTSDLMRRMVKEKLLKFDGTPLFPVRRAYTVPYRLSQAEASLYDAVTQYVKREFNRADALGGKKRTTIGFALTILQRRLASSPEAIYRSLRRRRERLRTRLQELEEFLRTGGAHAQFAFRGPELDLEDLEDAPEPVSSRYQRIAFEKSLVAPRGQTHAAFVCPGHPLLDAVLDLTLERNRTLLKRGAVLVDDRDHGVEPHVLLYLEHAVHDARPTRAGGDRVISKRMIYLDFGPDGARGHVRYAPYLDFRPLGADEPRPDEILGRPECAWIDRGLEERAEGYATENVVAEHLAEVGEVRMSAINKTEAAVKDRLTKEISYWDHRAETLKLAEKAGRTNARVNSGEAAKRADRLQARLADRLEELNLQRRISAGPPVVLGGMLVVPKGILDRIAGLKTKKEAVTTDTQAIAAKARNIVMDVERGMGYEPIDREFEKLGYDVESRVPETGKLRFIEVKGRVEGAPTITVTRNEILFSLNKPDDFVLAIVEFLEKGGHRVYYLRQPFQRQPDFGATSVNYNFADLLARAGEPS